MIIPLFKWPESVALNIGTRSRTSDETRRVLADEKKSAKLPTCLQDVEEGWQMRSASLPTCQPDLKEGSQMRRRKVPTCQPADLPTMCRRRLADEKRSADLPTCLPGVVEGWQIKSAGLSTWAEALMCG